MIDIRENNKNAAVHKSDTEIQQEQGIRRDWEEQLSKSLEIFDFSVPLIKKQKGTVRLFYNNCNSLEINNLIGDVLKRKRDKQTYQYIKDIENPTKVDRLLRQMKIWEVDIVSLAETCVAWENIVARRVTRQVTKSYDQSACWIGSSSKIYGDNCFKPGGTATVVMEECTGRILDKGSDPWKMGRWSYVLIGGNYRIKKLLVITGYRPGLRTGTVGLKTAWSQQSTILFKEKRAEQPNHAFLMDLEQWIREYKTSDIEILVCLDANEQWTDNSEIKRFAEAIDLINLNKEFSIAPTHPNLTNLDNSTMIDFCLGSRLVSENITFAASAPYDLETLGDHRGVLLELVFNKVSGDNSTEENYKHRKLQMNNPKAVEKYLTEVNKNFEKQSIYKRSRTLLSRVLTGHTDIANIMTKYEALDKEVYGICLKAEKKCRPQWAGQQDWSPELARAIKQLTYWRYRLKHDTPTPNTIKLEEELGMPFVEVSKQTIHQFINDSKVKLKEIQRQSQDKRHAHLEECAQQYANQHNISAQHAITELIAHEEARGTFKLLSRNLRNVDRTQLSTLWEAVDDMGEYTKDANRKRIYMDTKEIHKALLRRNARHLHQASGTPFAHGWLQRKLKWDGTGPIGHKMLTGDILNEYRFRESMQLYLESLKVNDITKLNCIKPYLSIEEYQKFWKKKRESTVTSPYGLHVGHYKAATHNLKILEVHRVLLLIPFCTGMVPVRWRRTVQTMLEKEPGAPWIHRLRIIELFDAQANAGFQIFVGRRMMRHAVNNNLLCAESFGSTPGKMAVSAVIQKTLATDQLRIERRAGGIFDCDASGCYDRILPPLASIHLQALGIQQTIGTFLARLMFLAKRHVKTKQGVSKANIGTKKKHVLHGIGQGNGGGPAMWISHLTVMFLALSSVCHGLVLSCVEQIKTVTTVGTGYVDDVTLGLSVPRDQKQNENTVYKYIKQMSQLWEKLLFITGGRLELSKCFWVPITWRWRQGKPSMITKHKGRKELFLKESETKKLVRIPRQGGMEVAKRLGINSSCDGRWSREFLNWITFSKNFGNKLRCSQVGRTAGQLAYQSIWIAKFRYSAPAVGFTKSQLKKIQQTIISPCLSQAGYCNKIPRAVVYGPSTYGGMGWDNIQVLSLVEKLKFLIGSIRLQDTVGRMFLIQLSWIQIFAGISTPILMETKQITYIPTGWLADLHTHLAANNIKVEIHDVWSPSRQRQEDKVIMDVVTATTPQWAWAGINRCRLYLKATTIADITSLDGTVIPERVRKVQSAIRNSTLLFPLQMKPCTTDINTWQYFVDSISFNGRLHIPLGRWLRTPDQIFPYVVEPQTAVLYKKNEKGWQVFGRMSKRSRRFRKTRLSVKTLPENWEPAKVIETHQCTIVLHAEKIIEESQLEQSDSRQSQDSKRASVLGIYEINQNQMAKLEQQWHTPQNIIVVATDGGLKDQMGTSSYAFFLPNDPIAIIEGYAGEYQPCVTASSTRQELLGQLGIEYWFETLECKWGRPRGGCKVVLVTDSQASIDIINHIPQGIGIRDMLRPELDVGLELYHQRQNKQWVHWKIEKVTSHIEVEEAPNEFYWGCNTYVDELATRARQRFNLEDLKGVEHYVFPGARVGCKIKGRVENNNLYTAVNEHIQGRELKFFLMEKYGWSEDIFLDIGWSAHAKELSKYPRLKRGTLIKYIHGWLATKRRRFREGVFQDPLCPLCGDEETKYHMLECSNQQLSEIRRQGFTQLLKNIADITMPGCRQVFQVGLATVFGSTHPQEQTMKDWPYEIRRAYQAQTDIGWHHVMYGRISRQWEQIATQSDTAEIQGLELWTGKVIRICWRFGLEIWKARNALVHGTDGKVSRLEQQRVCKIIETIYQHKGDFTDGDEWPGFPGQLTEVLHWTYDAQVTLLDRLRFLYPEEMKSISRVSDIQE